MTSASSPYQQRIRKEVQRNAKRGELHEKGDKAEEEKKVKESTHLLRVQPDRHIHKVRFGPL